MKNLVHSDNLPAQSALVIANDQMIKVLLSGPYKVPAWFRKRGDSTGRTFIIPCGQFIESAIHLPHVEATLDSVVTGLRSAGLKVQVSNHIENSKA